jgi:hypothetical protein
MHDAELPLSYMVTHEPSEIACMSKDFDIFWVTEVLAMPTVHSLSQYSGVGGLMVPKIFQNCPFVGGDASCGKYSDVLEFGDKRAYSGNFS